MKGMLRSIFQTEAWSHFKEQFGWRTHKVAGFAGMERVIGFGKSMLYFPELPLNADSLAMIRQSKQSELVTGRIFTRFEFLNVWTPENAKDLVELGLVKSFEDVQPDYRQWVLLDKSEDDLLKEMKPKGRYNIKIAERHNLQVDWGTDDQKIESLTRLYQETAKRTGFAGRGADYFHKLMTAIRTEKLGEIVTVSHEGEVLAAALVTFYGNVASYLYGGSGGDRSLMAPYLMHWAAIKRAKQEGCAVYDLLAIAPPEKENHVHAGLTRFKTQFGGESVRMLGSWDLVHSRFWYTMYRYAQKRRRRAL